MNDYSETTEYPLITDSSVLKKSRAKVINSNDDTEILQIGLLPTKNIIEKYRHLFKEKDKILVVSGDSFVHGDELADKDLPHYPGPARPQTGLNGDPLYFAPKEQMLRFKKYKESLFERDQAKYDELWVNERKKSFPMLIQQKRDDILVINLADRGESTQRNTRIIVEICASLKKEFPNKTIEAILGLSGPNRTEEITKHGYIWFHSGITHEKTSRENIDIKKLYGDYRKFFVNNLDNNSLIEKYAISLMWFFGCLDHLNIKYHLVLPNTVLEHLQEWNYEKIFFEKYGFIMKEKFKPIEMLSDREISKFMVKNVPIMHIGGHYVDTVHEMMRDKLLSVIFKDYYLHKIKRGNT